MKQSIISKNNKLEKVELKNRPYSIMIADHYDDLGVYLSSLDITNIFLNRGFCTSLEKAPPSNTHYKYVVLKNQDKPMGMYYFQYKRINLDLSLGLDKVVSKNTKERLSNKLKISVAKLFRSDVLVCGNMTLTGSNASFLSEEISDDGTLLMEVCEEVRKVIEKEGIHLRAILIKDFYAENRISKHGSYNEFMVQPNMILDIRSTWLTFDDYIDDMRSKYRVRVRRARKKSSNIIKKSLSLNEIAAHEEDLSRLYHNVVDHASFNLFLLPRDYFYELKHYLGDVFELIGYFDGEKMIGFSTIIYNDDNADAHFLGYDPVYNEECLLYLNMLYDLIEKSIEKRSTRLVMSRTAMAIKSSVGAKPHDMYLYMKATNAMVNRILKTSLQYLEPDADWVQRSPFKN